PTSIVPASMASSAASRRSKVDLPQPDGPTRAVSCPAGNAASIAWSASTLPDVDAYVFRTSRHSMPTRSGNAQRLRRVGAPCEPHRGHRECDRGGDGGETGEQELRPRQD